MALKIKLPPMAWRNSATTTLPRSGCWSVRGKRRKLVLRRRVGETPSRPQRTSSRTRAVVGAARVSGLDNVLHAMLRL